MIKSRDYERNVRSNYTKSLSNLLPYDIVALELKEFWLRKSFFQPDKGLAEIYAARNHIAGADVPTIQVLLSDKRWLLLQTPRYTQGCFQQINSGKIVNPFTLLLRIFQSFLALAQIFGFFLLAPGMIFMNKKEMAVWINSDIFCNQPESPIRNHEDAEQQFIQSFLAMVQGHMGEWEQVTNILKAEDVIKMLDWRSKLRRGSLTAVQASRQVFLRPDESATSFEHCEFRRYSHMIKGCQSVQEINALPDLECFQDDLSCSLTIKESEKEVLQKKVEKGLLYDENNMKYSVYDLSKDHEPPQEVRRTKKKFNLTSTSSTLEIFSQKLSTTIRRPLRLRRSEKEKEKEREQPKTEHKVEPKEGFTSKSEPPSIANELDGLFEDESKNQVKFGEEGDHQQLQKIAEEIEQILIW